MNYDRYISSAIELEDGNILMLGWNNGSQSENVSKKTEIFDIKNNKFIKSADSNYEHYGITYFHKADDKVLLIDNNPVEYYIISENKFVKTSLCILEDKCKTSNEYGKYTLFNAYNYDNDNLLIYSNFTPSQLYFWNITTGKRNKLPALNVDRKDYGILISNSGKIVIMGGYNSDKKFIKSAEIYNPQDKKFHVITNFELDSEIVPKLKPDGKEIKTNNYIYTINEKLKIPIKTQIKTFHKKYSTLKIDNKTSILLYEECLLFCTQKADLYLKDKDTILKGQKLLYKTNTLSEITKLNNGKYLIYGSNYEGEQKIPVRHTQILNISNIEDN